MTRINFLCFFISEKLHCPFASNPLLKNPLRRPKKPSVQWRPTPLLAAPPTRLAMRITTQRGSIDGRGHRRNLLESTGDASPPTTTPTPPTSRMAPSSTTPTPTRSTGSPTSPPRPSRGIGPNRSAWRLLSWPVRSGGRRRGSSAPRRGGLPRSRRGRRHRPGSTPGRRSRRPRWRRGWRSGGKRLRQRRRPQRRGGCYFLVFKFFSLCHVMLLSCLCRVHA